MNYGISVLFRAIPVFMALFCFSFGSFVYEDSLFPGRLVAGPVLIALGGICVALFATAATIIRQIINSYNVVAKYALPILGYSVAIITFLCGRWYMHDGDTAAHFVAGHVICGISFIVACVSTTAAVSTRFMLIPENAASNDDVFPVTAFTPVQVRIFIGIVATMAAVAWLWALYLLSRAADGDAFYIAGHVMSGLACVCTSLVALVVTILRQICNRFVESDGRRYPFLVIAMGTLAILWGLVVLAGRVTSLSVTGYIMIGLGLVCFSISSKVILLAAVWRRTFKLANRIPLIPIFTAFICLFLSAFLFEMASTHSAYFVPARVLAGLGAICFTLFSIVSILESGTSGK
ncbi:MAG: DUF2776 domain-containing protein [Bacteroidales bacterium]|nr:DUF2776 domain-containing protein [Bacteroidales bacterium]